MKGTMRSLVCILSVIALVLIPSFSWSGDDAYLLKKGTKEIGISSGFGASFSSNRVVNMIPLNLRYGAILTDPMGPSFLKGNVELLGEGTYDYVFHHQRKYGIGLSGLLRYNFIAGDCFKPFVQIGIGVYHSNLKMKDFPNDFNFLSQFGVGFNWFITPQVALQADGRVQHYSNAGFYEHNAGLNMQKFDLGIAYFFE